MSARCVMVDTRREATSNSGIPAITRGGITSTGVIMASSSGAVASARRAIFTASNAAKAVNFGQNHGYYRQGVIQVFEIHPSN